MKRKQDRKSTSFSESENDSNIRTTRRSTRLSKINSPNKSLIIEAATSNLTPQKCRNKKEKVIQNDKSPKVVKNNKNKTPKVLNVESDSPKAGSTRRTLRKRISSLEDHESKEESLDVEETEKLNVVLFSERHELGEVDLDKIEDTKINELHSEVLEMSETEENLKETIEHHETTSDIKPKVSNIDIINSPKVRGSRRSFKKKDSKATIKHSDYVDDTAQSEKSFKELELKLQRLDSVENIEQSVVISEDQPLNKFSLDNIKDTNNANEFSEVLKKSETEENLKAQFQHHKISDIKPKVSIIKKINSPKVTGSRRSLRSRDSKATINNKDYVDNTAQSASSFTEEPELNDKRLDTVEYTEQNEVSSSEELGLGEVNIDNIEDANKINELSSEVLKMSETEENLKAQIKHQETSDFENAKDINSISEDPELSEYKKGLETEDETINNVENCEKQSKLSDNESDLELSIDYENDFLSDNEDIKLSDARNCSKEDEENLMEVENSHDNADHDGEDEYNISEENGKNVFYHFYGSEKKFTIASNKVFTPSLNCDNNIKETTEKMDEGNENTNELSPLIRNSLFYNKIKLSSSYTGKRCHFTNEEEHCCLVCDSPELDSLNFVKHIQNRQHILRCLEIFNKDIYCKYADDIETSTSELYRIALEKEALWPWTNAENEEKSKIISNIYETLEKQYSSKSSSNMDTFTSVFLLGNAQFYYTLQELENDEKLHNNLTILSESDLFMNNLIDYFERSSNSSLENALWVIFVGIESVFNVNYFASNRKYRSRSINLNARFLKSIQLGGNNAKLSLIDTLEEFVNYAEYVQTRIKKMLGKHSNVVLIPFEPVLFTFVYSQYNQFLVANVITSSRLHEIRGIYNTLAKMFISLIHPDDNKELKRFKYYFSSVTSFLSVAIPFQKIFSLYRYNLSLLYKDKDDYQHDDNVKNVKFDYFIFVGPHYIRYVIPNDPRFLFARENFPFTRKDIDDLLDEYDRSRKKRILIILIVDVTVLGTNEILEICQDNCESKMSFVNIEGSELHLKENSCIYNVQHIRQSCLMEKGVLVLVAPLFPKLYISDKGFLDNHRKVHGLLECNYIPVLIKCNGTVYNDFKKAAVRFNLNFFNGFNHLLHFKDYLPNPLCEVFNEYDATVDQWMTELYYLMKYYDNDSPSRLGKGNKINDFIDMSDKLPPRIEPNSIVTTEKISSTTEFQSAVERARELAKKFCAPGKKVTKTLMTNSESWQQKSDEELIGSFVGRNSSTKNMYNYRQNQITYNPAAVNTSNNLCGAEANLQYGALTQSQEIKGTTLKIRSKNNLPMEFILQLIKQVDADSETNRCNPCTVVVKMCKRKAQIMAHFLNNCRLGFYKINADFFGLEMKMELSPIKTEVCNIINHIFNLQKKNLFNQSIATVTASLLFCKEIDLRTYKIQFCENNSCSQGRECPYYHSHLDMRRNPFKQSYKYAKCFGEQRCKRKFCKYSHNEIEYTYHPAVYKAAADNPFSMIFTKRWKNCLMIGLECTPRLVNGIIKNLPKIGINRKGISAIVVTVSIMYAEFLHSWISSLPPLVNKSIATSAIASGTFNANTTDIIFGTINQYLTISTASYKMFQNVEMIVIDDVQEIFQSEEITRNLFVFLKNLKNVSQFENVQKAVVAENSSVNLLENTIKFFNCGFGEFKCKDSKYYYSEPVNRSFGLKELQDGVLTGKGLKRKKNSKYNVNQKQPKIDTNSYTLYSLEQQIQPPYATATNFATQNPQQFEHSYYGQASTYPTMQQFGSVGPTTFTPPKPPAQPYGSAMAFQPQHSYNMYASPVQQNVPNQSHYSNMYAAPMQQNVPNQSQSFNTYSAHMQQNVPNQSQSFNMYASPVQHNVPNQGHSSLTNLNVSQNNDNMYPPFQEETSVPSLRRSSDIRGASTDNIGETTEEIEKYIQMPNLHPDFIVQYQTFISQDPSHNANNAYIKQKWDSFWRGYLTSKRVSSIGNSEAVADSSIGKSKAVAPTDIHKGLTSDAASSSNLDESKVFDDLIMLNNFSKNLFYLGKDLDDMILKSLELGPDDEKVLSFLGKDLNAKILRDISLSIKNATNIPPNQQGLYKKTSETITNLLRKIERKTDLDISDIAKIAEATVGKDSSVIRHVIETSLKGRGHASPSGETVNKIYLEVCSHHFRMAIE